MQYLYDADNIVQETQGSSINAILTGLGVDERFARSDVKGRTYFLSDLLNSTIALTDPNGAIKEQYSYDPYGNVTSSDTTTGFTNPYQYTGRETDTSGFYYYRARYYSPVMGGFISEDRAGFGGGQLSFYAYAGSNPLDFSDPSGKGVPEAVIGAIAGGAWGYFNGEFVSHDCGDKLRNDILAGIFVGALTGFTDGLNLFEGGALEWGTGVALRAGINSLGEEARQIANDGAVDDGWAVVAAASGGILSDSVEGFVNGVVGDEISNVAKLSSAAASNAIGGFPGTFENQQNAGAEQQQQINEEFRKTESHLH